MKAAGFLCASESGDTQLRSSHPLCVLDAVLILKSHAVISISADVHPATFLAQKNNYFVSALECLDLVSVRKKGGGGKKYHT